MLYNEYLRNTTLSTDYGVKDVNEIGVIKGLTETQEKEIGKLRGFIYTPKKSEQKEDKPQSKTQDKPKEQKEETKDTKKQVKAKPETKKTTKTQSKTTNSKQTK